ncbi:hypothetical protein QBC34DRAFT_438044 [Podospora aff. communis PSN243]|uniref:Uncharacterized protein n=1 Tax=Podospora aff. communis PSN243 TaxID=3040156 RepID=A0AAV9GNQ5_9PEZI|nr:hypothetical protein QBC34DRAFT_438044 [Podospora aff. communis PSN243]
MATLFRSNKKKTKQSAQTPTLVLSGAIEENVPRPEDLNDLEHQVERQNQVHREPQDKANKGKHRRSRWSRPWHRSPDVQAPQTTVLSPLPNGSAVQPRFSTAADSGVDAGTATPVTTSVSAASRETRRSALGRLRQQPSSTAGEGSASQTQAQPTQLAPASGIPVEVRLRALERLQKLELASSLGLRADRMADFTDAERLKLTQFQNEFNSVRIDWFRGRPMPNVRFELVVLTKDGAAPSGTREGTSICIRGLQTDDEIKEFHRVMSRDFVRRLYRPMRLTYDTSLIRAAAREIDETYDYQQSSFRDTLCGTTIHTAVEGTDGVVSTIGGIIAAGGRLFAVTTSHRPKQEPLVGATSPASTFGASTLVEGEYDQDVESPLILDTAKIEPKIEPPSERQPVPTYFWPRLSIDPTQRGLEGDDWRLLPISGEHCFPNYLASRGRLIGPQGRGTYITDYMRTPSKTKVHVLGGLTGISTGTLLASPSYLSIHGSPAEEVWTIIFDRPLLKEGDSGSWVVDSSGVLVGMVRALSGDEAYLVPFCLQKQDIVSQVPELEDVTLPSPLQCWLEVASATRGDPAARTHNEAAEKALSLKVLTASEKSDSLARTLQSARIQIGASPVEMMQLEDLLSREGNKLRDSLSRTSASDTGYISDVHRRLRRIHQSLNPSLFPGEVEQSSLRGSEDSEAARQSTELSGAGRRDTLSLADEANHPADTDTKEPHFSTSNFLISILSLGVLSAAAGIASAAVLEAVTGLEVMVGSGRSAISGAAVGATLAAPTALVELILLPAWPMGLMNPMDPESTLQRSSSSRSPTPRPFDFRWWLGLFVSFAIVFLRPFFAVEIASYVTESELMSTNRSVLRIAATAAAAPLFGDSLVNNLARHSHVLDGYNFKSKRPRALTTWAYAFTLWLYITGWDALAGYTFARVARNWGAEVASDAAAAAAGATFGAVSLLWSFVASFIRWYFGLILAVRKDK